MNRIDAYTEPDSLESYISWLPDEFTIEQKKNFLHTIYRRSLSEQEPGLSLDERAKAALLAVAKIFHEWTEDAIVSYVREVNSITKPVNDGKLTRKAHDPYSEMIAHVTQRTHGLIPIAKN